MNYATSSPPQKRTLTPEEENAIVWCADQQVALALKHGTISKTQAEEHWFQVAQDLVDDPELLKMMVEGCERSKKNARITSSKIYQDYEAGRTEIRGNDCTVAKTSNPRTTAIAGAVVLAIASPLTPIFAQSAFATPQGSVVSTGQGSPFPKKEHELPPHDPPKVRRVVKNRGEREEEPSAGRSR